MNLMGLRIFTICMTLKLYIYVDIVSISALLHINTNELVFKGMQIVQEKCNHSECFSFPWLCQDSSVYRLFSCSAQTHILVTCTYREGGLWGDLGYLKESERVKKRGPERDERRGFESDSALVPWFNQTETSLPGFRVHVWRNAFINVIPLLSNKASVIWRASEGARSCGVEGQFSLKKGEG